MKSVIIDTNVLIYWYKQDGIGNIAMAKSISPIFSVITKIEALGFKDLSVKEAKIINSLLNTGLLAELSSEIVDITIKLRQKHRIKTPDAIIAATAIVYNAELWTANTSDFKSIDGLKLFNPIFATR